MFIYIVICEPTKLRFVVFQPAVIFCYIKIELEEEESVECYIAKTDQCEHPINIRRKF